MNKSQHIYEFGDFRLDPSERLLLHNGSPVSLTPKAFDLLHLLVRNHGHLMAKEELMQAVWPDSFVEEINLTQNISVIRKALGSAAQGDKYVETVPKQGYRFNAAVSERPAAAREVAAQPDVSRTPQYTASSVSTSSAALSSGLHSSAQLPSAPSTWKRRVAGVLVAIGTAAAVVWLISWQFNASFLASGSTHPQSIAVLPLLNLSGDTGQEYFADGITDELTTQLAKIGSIRVISRTSAMRYKNSQKPLPEIARELHVDAIVEGSVVKSENRVRLTAQLIDASTDRHLWAESYDSQSKDAFLLPRTVARDVASKVKGQLSLDDKLRLAQNHPVVPAAYEAYFKGRYFWNKRTQADLKKSMEFFQQAIQQDPAYAPAYAGAATCYLSFASYALAPAPEAYLLGREMAAKALELDDTLSGPHVALGVIHAEYELDVVAAEKEFRQAIALNPNDAQAHQFYAEDVLEADGRTEEAKRELATAEQLDPTLMMTRAQVGYAYFLARDYDRAIDEARKTLELEPSFAKGHQILAIGYEAKGMYPEAIQEFKAAAALDTNPAFVAGLARTYALNGQPEEAKRAYDQLLAMPQPNSARAYQAALYELALGQGNKAMASLEQAYNERCWILLYLKVDPRLDPLRSDPRFKTLLQHVHYTS